MALPRGGIKSKNGRRVYSQSARAVRYRQEMGVGEFAEDAVTDTPTPPLAETPPELVSAPEGLSTESIGVATTVRVPVEATPPPDDEEDIYRCDNCQEIPIKKGTPECPTCEEPLNWSGLT